MSFTPKLFLASKSPRRAELLRRMGLPFEVLAVEIDEQAVTITDPVARVLQLSRLKAEAVYDQVDMGLIVGADTVVFLDDRILGKPKNPDEAVRMLRALSGKTHDVFTGFTLLDVGGGEVSDVERTAVTFRDLEPWEIRDYVATGGPLDKAGGYGIQDRSGFFVDRIEGCFYNVVGFPLTKFYEGLKRLLDHESMRRLISLPT